ncbi:uncharacterized protein LOC126600186 [Malus sylvestris]|uniref:uncharacterized protein LOC126600186 n=1 Tax=Malus sylvestris TaxID=3752 RepID=UPI0021AC9380|nr:uncharacterized protein LOC126600186 [Malus sylvestris]
MKALNIPRGVRRVLFQTSNTDSAQFVFCIFIFFGHLSGRLSLNLWQPLYITQITESEDKRIIREFVVMLDAYEEERGKKFVIPISERFMGMKAAIYKQVKFEIFWYQTWFQHVPN